MLLVCALQRGDFPGRSVCTDARRQSTAGFRQERLYLISFSFVETSYHLRKLILV